LTRTASLKTSMTATTLAPTATLIQSPNPYPPHSGKLVLNEALSTDSGRFRLSQGCTFTRGSLSCQALEQGFRNACPIDNSSNYQNFVFETQMNILKGDAGGI